jgi:hypothetical protein
MQAFAHFLVRRSTAWATVFIVLVVSAVSVFFAARVQRDDDVLAFLPRSNPEVGVFYDVNKRFGGLDVAIVGIGADDVFTPDFLTRLRALTRRLNETDGIGYAMSLANFEDFTADPTKGGITTDYLVSKIPESDADRAQLREKVMSRDQAVGNVVSEDGKAALVYVFAGYGADMKTVAQKVRAATEEAFPKEPKYWGGAPFISTYIYDITQEDMRKLAPWAVLVIILITIASFRDVIGAGLALLSTAMGIVMALGLMGLCGVAVNVVLSSLPVILFALGSAYAVHILSRYYVVAEGEDRPKALVRTLVEVGPPVLASGLTTVAGLLSFTLMDIAPLRTFGLFTALGILFTLILSMTFVPAVILLARLKGKPPEQSEPSRLHAWLCTLPQRRRLAMGAGIGATALVFAFFVGRVDSRMDNAAFFAKNSPPDRAEAFLRDHFGGSLFLQIQVEGDMTDPAVLREIRALGDRIAVLPNVSSVNHVSHVVAQINEAMEGDRRLPDTAAKVKLLYGFLEGKKAVRQLVTDDRRHALLHIKLGTQRASDTEPLVEQIRQMAASSITTRFAVVPAEGPRQKEVQASVRGQVALRIGALSRQFGVAPPDASELEKRLGEPAPAGDAASVEAELVAFLGSEESSVELDGPLAAKKVAAAIAPLGPKPEEAKLAEAIAGALAKPADDALVTDLADTVDKPLEEMWRRSETLGRARRLVADLAIAPPPGPKGERFLTAVAAALMDMDLGAAALPAGAGEEAKELGIAVTGLPVMHAGLSKSVEKNQWASLSLALGLVLVIMSALFRSVWSGLLGVAPIVLTMLVIYGLMGILDVRLDIGTSMLASLIIGAGVDYAVHLMVAWNAPDDAPLADSARTAARRAGPAIWVNAIMVSAGFFVLTLGDARPLQNVGGLTATAMLTAALATMLVIPLFARKRRYARAARIPEGVRSSEAPGAVLDTSASPP